MVWDVVIQQGEKEEKGHGCIWLLKQTTMQFQP